MSNEEPRSLTQQTARNVAWLGVGQAIRQGVAVLTMVALARFLEPGDFGIFAMTLFVNELAQLLVQFGVGAAIIQRKEVNQVLLSSCLWINLAIAAVVALALVAIGPWVAAYFEQGVIRWLVVPAAFNLLISALAVLPQALLSRNLAFADVTIGTLIGSLCGAAAALVMGFSGAGVWALAIQPVVGSLVTTGYYYQRTRWWPSWVYDFASVRGLLRFSGQLLMSNFVGHVTRNLPSLVLGPALGVTALGLINMAQTICWLPVAQFSQTVVRATFPVFSQIQDDLPRFREGFNRATSTLALLTFPIMLGMGVLSPDFVPLVFGTKWTPAVALVSILCVPAMVQSITTLSGTALLATGRGGQLLNLALAALLVTAVPLWLARNASAEWAAVALSAAMVVSSLASLLMALRAIQAPLGDYWRAIRTPAICAAGMALLLLLARGQLEAAPALLRLVGLSILGGLLYLAMVWRIQPELITNVLALARRAR